MAETVQAAPVEAQGPAKGVVARMIGVITSPGEAMREIVAKPEFLAPLIINLVFVAAVLLVHGMRANWETIVTDQIERSPILQAFGDQVKDRALREGVAGIKSQTQLQLALRGVAGALLIGPLIFQFMSVLYATLFVLMGALSDLRLGRAWLMFGANILVGAAFVLVQIIAGKAFGSSAQSAQLMLCTSMIVTSGVMLWVIRGSARKDPAYHKVLSVCTYSSVVGIIGAAVALTIVFVNPDSANIPYENLVKSSVGSWFTLGIPILDSLLKSLDVFTIWWLVVLTIGFRWATRLSPGVTATITFLPWGAFVLLKLAWAAVFGK